MKEQKRQPVIDMDQFQLLTLQQMGPDTIKGLIARAELAKSEERKKIKEELLELKRVFQTRGNELELAPGELEQYTDAFQMLSETQTELGPQEREKYANMLIALARASLTLEEELDPKNELGPEELKELGLEGWEEHGGVYKEKSTASLIQKFSDLYRESEVAAVGSVDTPVEPSEETAPSAS